MPESLALANPLTVLLDKERSDFTRADLLRVVKEKSIERLTFHYTSLDGKLRELKLPFADHDQAERILAAAPDPLRQAQPRAVLAELRRIAGSLPDIHPL